MLDKFEVVKTFSQMGYKVPLDVAVSLLGDGYDISEFDNNLDGFSVEDIIDYMEKYEY